MSLFDAEALRTADMPLYTFRNNTTGEVIKTTDPGRALITGKWKHMNVFKGPILRGLACTCTVLQQRIGSDRRRCGQFLQPALSVESERSAEEGPRRLPALAVMPGTMDRVLMPLSIAVEARFKFYSVRLLATSAL